MYSLLVTAKLKGTDPRAWLTDVLRRINGHPAARLHGLLPWNRRKPIRAAAAAASSMIAAPFAGWMQVFDRSDAPTLPRTNHDETWQLLTLLAQPDAAYIVVFSN